MNPLDEAALARLRELAENAKRIGLSGEVHLPAATILALLDMVERLQNERDAWEMTSKVGFGAAKAYRDVAEGKQIDPSIIRDATNRINAARNYAPPCVTRFEMEQAFEIVREAMIANRARAASEPSTEERA